MDVAKPVLLPVALLDVVLAVILPEACSLAPAAVNMAAPVAMSWPFGGAGIAAFVAPFWADAVEVALAVDGVQEEVDAPATAPTVPALEAAVVLPTAAALPVLVLLFMVLTVPPVVLPVSVLPALVFPLAVLPVAAPEPPLALVLLALTEPEAETPPEPLLVTPEETVTLPLPLAVVATDVMPVLAEPPLLFPWQAARPRLRMSAPATGARR